MSTRPATGTPTALPFHLSGNFAPVDDEISVDELEVTGHLPPELSGAYVRNGPNPRHGPTPHWFLGQGMLHAVRLAGGRALGYRNRWVDAPTTANTSIVRHAGRLLALAETTPPIEVDTELRTLGPHTFGGALTQGMTAHPKTCPLTGELLFFTYALQAPHLTFYRADAAGVLRQAEPIEVGSPTYMHDFAITERHVLFFDLPVLYRGWHDPEPIRWSESYGARLGVLPRGASAAQMRWFEIAPGTIGHTVNAYEDGSTLVLDVVRGARLDAPTRLHRYLLDLARGTVEERPLDGRHVEFPRIDERRTGLRHRHASALELCDFVNGAPTHTVLRRYDLETGRGTAHDFGPGRLAGEAVFVPAGATTGENEGYLLSLVYDRARHRSDLVVLDAADLAAAPIASVHLPRRVPFGIHGQWFADAD